MNVQDHPSAVTVGSFFRREFLSASGFESWESLPLEVAVRDPGFLGRLLRTRLLFSALTKAIVTNKTTLSVVSAFLEEPEIAQGARLGSTGAMMKDRPDLVGPGDVVFTGVDVERGLSDKDLVLSVEGFDAHPVLAPRCHDAIVRMRRKYEGTVSYLRAATNQFHLNRVALDMRLMTLGLLDPCDDFTQSSV